MRSLLRLILAAACLAFLFSAASESRACPAHAGTQPADPNLPPPTHLLTLYSDEGDNKGAEPMKMWLWLPADWETTGTDGKRQCAAEPSENKLGEMMQVIDFKIGHGEGKYAGYINFDLHTMAWHQNFYVEKRRENDAGEFRWTWMYAYAGIGGDPSTGSITKGHATLEPVNAPATQPK